MHQDAGLAASRAGHDEEVANGSGHRLPLTFVQAVEDVGYVQRQGRLGWICGQYTHSETRWLRDDARRSIESWGKREADSGQGRVVGRLARIAGNGKGAQGVCREKGTKPPRTHNLFELSDQAEKLGARPISRARLALDW